MGKQKRPYKAHNYTHVFESVIASYLENLVWLRFAGIQSSNAEEGAKRRSLFRSVEFVADVETATRQALNGVRHLEDAFDQMSKELAGDKVDEGLSLAIRSEVVQKCAKAYQSGGLQPHIYFRARRR